ncbi:sec1 family domain-containing protein 2 [Patella vulgata]|uniref:sec1 family domain-containing protein 2 n=1 Tax=Patella vulgata TaxID=6465 RepID=UPI00218053BE|nr:sec1 family domain-containing protein 2 [Patella vulgata]
MDVNRQLVESASNVKLPVKLSGKPGRVTPNVLYDTLNLFRANYSAIQPNLDILQVAMATAQTISHKKHGNLDNIVSVEKKILQMVGDKDSPSILCELTKILKTESQKPISERILNLDDILSLLIFSYSLSGADFSEDEENQFQADLIEVIIKEKEDLPPVLKAIIGDTINRSIVMAIVEDIWCKLVAIGTARQNLQQFSSVYERGGIMAPTECKPLLNQIIEEILNPAKGEILDIKYKQSGMKDLLKSGFGLFMNVSKPRPSDHPLLLLYIVGGVTPTEVKHIQDIVHKSKTHIQVVIGSTRLLRNTDAILSSLSTDNVTFQT